MAIRTLTPLASSRALLGLTPLLDLHRDMNRIFDGALRTMDSRQPETAFPRIEVQESQEEFRLLADLPGLGRDDVELSVEGDVLTISGERAVPELKEGSTRHIAERAYGSFSRSIKLPFLPEASQVTADIENGVLSVCVPKVAVERGRRIQIGSARPTAAVENALKNDEAVSASAQSASQRVIDKAASRQPQGATA